MKQEPNTPQRIEPPFGKTKHKALYNAVNFLLDERREEKCCDLEWKHIHTGKPADERQGKLNGACYIEKHEKCPVEAEGNRCVCICHKPFDENYLDARTPEERANEPKSSVTTVSLPPPTSPADEKKEFPKYGEWYFYRENNKWIKGFWSDTEYDKERCKEAGWSYKLDSEPSPDLAGLETLTERIVIDYANLSGRDSENRAEFRRRVKEHLSSFLSLHTSTNSPDLAGWQVEFDKTVGYITEEKRLEYLPTNHSEHDSIVFDAGYTSAGFQAKSFLSLHTKKLRERVKEIKERFRCAACDGAKCEHTLGCQALEKVLSVIEEVEPLKDK